MVKKIEKLKTIKTHYKIIILITSILLTSYISYITIFNQKTIFYQVSQIQKGTIITSISGNGKVSVSNEIVIRPKIAGEILSLNVKEGQEVKTGTLIAQLDTREAQKAVRDAELNLQSAKLALEKLKKPADTLSILQAENSLAQAKELKQKAEDDLKKAYEDGFNAVSNTFLDLPTIMTGLEDMMFDNTIDPNSGASDNITWYVNQTNYQESREKAIIYMNNVYTVYNNARKIYEKNFNDYKTTSRNTDRAIIEKLIFQTYETTKIIADTIKTIDNYIDFVVDDMKKNKVEIPAMVSTHQLNINSYTNKANSHLLNLLNIKRIIEDSKNFILNSERSIAEKTEYLAKLKAGADELDIQTAELNVKQKENAFLDAKEKLADYYIRAPFNGIITNLTIKKGELVSPTTIIGTLITKQKIVEISLNEIDFPKIKIGNEATLTFDAFPELKIKGKVIETSTIGTEEQGVVSYNVKISLEEDKKEIKPGMSVNAEIITEKKENILIVPNSAIKNDKENKKYVEVVKNNFEIKKPSEVIAIDSKFIEKRYIETGILNEELTEVLEGLNEGELIIVKKLTNQPVEKNKQQANPFLPRSPFQQRKN